MSNPNDVNKNLIDDRIEATICMSSALAPAFLLIIWLISVVVYLVAPIDSNKAAFVKESGSKVLLAGLTLIGNGRQREKNGRPS